MFRRFQHEPLKEVPIFKEDTLDSLLGVHFILQGRVGGKPAPCNCRSH